jgi:glutathione peroxidase
LTLPFVDLGDPAKSPPPAQRFDTPRRALMYRSINRWVCSVGALWALFSPAAHAQPAKDPAQSCPPLLQHTMARLQDEKPQPLCQYSGKVLLVVNTASFCGFTPQYKELETLYEQYKDQLVIVGFPANNFLFQEPKGNTEIAAFCQRNYGVSFPMSEKVSVKGKDIAPIYYWLTHKKYNGLKDAPVKWNFQKYLLDEKGKLIAVFNPKSSPLSKDLVELIKNK